MVSCAMRIVSSRGRRRNNSGRNVNIFKARKIGRFLTRKAPRFRTKTALELALELALGVVWCTDRAQRFKRDERPCANVVAGPAARRSGLVPDRGEQVSAAADGANDSGLGRVRLDLAADAHDPEIDGAVEGFGVARICELQ